MPKIKNIIRAVQIAAEINQLSGWLKNKEFMHKKTRRFGLIGFPITQSFSPGYFSAKFEKEGIRNCSYHAFPLTSIELLGKLIAENPALEGLNVTIPYKTQVIPYLDEISEEAAAIGAVNVIKIKKGKLTGYNSDVYGFENSLLNFLPKPFPTSLKALVLGTGGAAKAVQFSLKKLDIPFQSVSRKPSPEVITYHDISPAIIASHQLIINTTPLGMTPDLDASPPIPYEAATPHHYFYDLIYNPEKTQFLSRAEAKGGHVQNGLAMLYLQAERAWEIWNSPNDPSQKS